MNGTEKQKQSRKKVFAFFSERDKPEGFPIREVLNLYVRKRHSSKHSSVLSTKSQIKK